MSLHGISNSGKRSRGPAHVQFLKSPQSPLSTCDVAGIIYSVSSSKFPIQPKAHSKPRNARTIVPLIRRSFPSFARSAQFTFTNARHVKPISKQREETYKFFQRLVALVLRAHSECPRHILRDRLPPPT